MKIKIEVYYIKEKDAVVIVKNGEIQSYDEGVNSCEYLNEFGIDSVDEFDTLTGEEIQETYENILEDFKANLPEEVESYYEHLKTATIEGKLLTTKHIKIKGGLVV